MGRDDIEVEINIKGGIEVSSGDSDPVAVQSIAEKEIKIRDAYGLCFNKNDLKVIQRKLREQILCGYEKGETLDQVAVRIRSALADYVNVGLEQARTIAATEVMGAASYGSYVRIKQSGFRKKEWLSAMDDRVRPLHREMHGKIINTGDLWVFSDGNTLRYPGDPKGPDHLVVGCRCIEVVVPESHWTFSEDDEGCLHKILQVEDRQMPSMERIPCPNACCIGVINEKGVCGTCGKPYLPEHEELMNKEPIQIGKAQACWNVSGTKILKYTLEMYHKGLNEHKIISAPDTEMLENKANLQLKKWQEIWKITESKEANIEQANSRTQEANKALQQIDNLLIHSLSIDNKVNWENLKQADDYPEKSPPKPRKKNHEVYPLKPDKQSSEFIPPLPTLTFFEKLIKFKRERKIQKYDQKRQECEQRYLNALSEWEQRKSTIDKLNSHLDKEFEKELIEWEDQVSEWEKRKEVFLQKQSEFNAKIDTMQDSYYSQNGDSIVEYCEMVLNNSEYPESFPKNFEFELEYNPENRILVVEYELPPIESFPKIKEVKYIASQKELKESYIPESQMTKMFDDTMYKITLRTIHELFEADVINAIEAISFNGWVKAVNKATGREENNCILSVQTKKGEFTEIDLSNVDPKICFRSLKGVASSKLSSLTPIQPILQISKGDKRFVEGHSVTGEIDNSTNLAAMDWEDFEHLIRELFEKEFQSSGGEVKVTRASRDGGVDAVAFDPDPIRGGKIVIQAKRYTNTVGVSAVRDLYGTVVNEGATKGILVSTADYGPDAYEFAKGKPLTLLNGSNLLHLLEKHGHHAKIDLREAKRMLTDKER